MYFTVVRILITISSAFSNETPQLYTVLPEKKTDRVGQAMMGSTHVYDLAPAATAQKSKSFSLDPKVFNF